MRGWRQSTGTKTGASALPIGPKIPQKYSRFLSRRGGTPRSFRCQIGLLGPGRAPPFQPKICPIFGLKVQTAAWACVFGLPWSGCWRRPRGRSVVTGAGWGPKQRFALQAVIKKRTSRPQGLSGLQPGYGSAKRYILLRLKPATQGSEWHRN